MTGTVAGGMTHLRYLDISGWAVGRAVGEVVRGANGVL